jgi:hypothetical protein
MDQFNEAQLTSLTTNYNDQTPPDPYKQANHPNSPQNSNQANPQPSSQWPASFFALTYFFYYLINF